MTEDEVHRYRGRASSTLADLPRPVAALLEWAARSPDSRCLTTIGPDGTSTTWTYLEAAAATRRLAVTLHRAFDLQQGTIVSLAPVNDGSSVVALLALMRLGCPTLLLNPLDPPLRRQQQTAALGAGLVLCPPTLSATLTDAVPLPVDAAEDSSLDEAAHVDARVEPRADALYFGTSGSTSASKLVAQSYLNIAANASGVGRHHALDPGTRLLTCLPVHHVNALHFAVVATLIAGGHAILASTFDPLRFPRLIEHWSPRIVSVVPVVLDALVRTWRQPRVPDSLAYFVSAAAPLQARTAADVMQRFGRRVLQGYGLTETTNFSATMPRGLPDEEYRRLMVDCEIPSIGVAIDGNEVAIARADGSPAGLGEVGEVVMRGFNVMNGYAGNLPATREAFADGWFHSGDLGYAIEGAAGQRFFVITGRLKNVAKVRGESVSLEEMDRALCALPGVEDAACVAVPDAVLGEAIVAAVCCSAECDDLALRGGLARQFAAAVLPRRFVRVASIPRTPTGKLRRDELAERLQR